MAVRAVPVPVVLRRSDLLSLILNRNSPSFTCLSEFMAGSLPDGVPSDRPNSASAFFCDMEGFHSTKLWGFASSDACGVRLPKRDQENLFCHY